MTMIKGKVIFGIVTLVLITSLVSAGCSQDNQEAVDTKLQEAEAIRDYYKAIVSINQIYANTDRALTQLSGKNDLAEFYGKVKTAEKIYNEALKALEELKPPAELKGVHQKLEKSVALRQQAASSLRLFIETGKSSHQRKSALTMKAAGRNMRSAMKSLKRKIDSGKIDLRDKPKTQTL